MSFSSNSHCKDCNSVYVGETKRNLKTRLSEHRYAVSRGDGITFHATHSAMILMEKSTGVKRAIRKHPPEWYYYKNEEFGYVPHEGLECKAIENMLQHGASAHF